MKKLLATTLSLGLLAVTPVFAADPSSMSGFSVGATAEFSGGSSSATDGTSDNGRSNALGLQARYDWAITPTIAVGLGGSYSSSNHLAGTYASGVGVVTNNRYSLDVIPSIAVGNDLTLFGKVSSIYGSAASDDGVNSANVQGVGYGIGARRMLDKKTYLQVGYDVNKFNDVTFATGTTSSLKDNVFSIGVGYKF
jgi:opacity protein-like surface antigen